MKLRAEEKHLLYRLRQLQGNHEAGALVVSWGPTGLLWETGAVAYLTLGTECGTIVGNNIGGENGIVTDLAQAQS